MLEFTRFVFPVIRQLGGLFVGILIGTLLVQYYTGRSQTVLECTIVNDTGEPISMSLTVGINHLSISKLDATESITFTQAFNTESEYEIQPYLSDNQPIAPLTLYLTGGISVHDRIRVTEDGATIVERK
jgi:hypothetical protein